METRRLFCGRGLVSPLITKPVFLSLEGHPVRETPEHE